MQSLNMWSGRLYSKVPHWAIAFQLIFFYHRTWPWTDNCQGRSNPLVWINAKHRIQSTLLLSRISLLLRDFLPVKARLSQTGSSLESTFSVQWFLILTWWRNMTDIFSMLPHCEKWVGGWRSHAWVWTVTVPTVPATLLLRHESQAYDSSAAMLNLEEDERAADRFSRHLAWMSVERRRFTLGCYQLLLQPTHQQANAKP